jgi:flagellar assembly factor FliW
MKIINTKRFGDLCIEDKNIVNFSSGLIGFSGLNSFCIIDSSDPTSILWLQSLEQPLLAFPILEPKIFYPEYVIKLSSLEQSELKMKNLKNAAVFSILTIPENIPEMTANLKAPIIINIEEQMGKQLILQENDLPIQYPIFNILQAYISQISNDATNYSTIKPVEIHQIKNYDFSNNNII